LNKKEIRNKRQYTISSLKKIRA